MYEKAETYEEARRIIQSEVDNDVGQHNRRIQKKRLAFVAGAGVAIVTAVGLTANDPYLTYIVGLGAFCLTMGELIPFLRYLHIQNKIRDGSFFDSRTEEEIIKMANEYVENYNKDHKLSS